MDNQRLILFIVFSFSLLLLWEAWQDKNAPPPVAPSTTSAPATGTPTPSQALNAPAAAPAQTGFAKGQRAVVETEIAIGLVKFTAEITLTDRTDMGVPMLLGRATIRGKFIVHPGRSYLISRTKRKSR